MDSEERYKYGHRGGDVWQPDLNHVSTNFFGGPPHSKEDDGIDACGHRNRSANRSPAQSGLTDLNRKPHS